MELKTGSAESTLDDKGRVNIPVRFREYFQGKLVITCGFERSVLIMTPAVWENFERSLRNSDAHIHAERQFLENKHLSQAQVVEVDKVGRIAVPATLRKYAGLTKDCMVIRSEGRMNIWDSGTWDAYLEENDELAREAINKLGTQDIFRVG